MPKLSLLNLSLRLRSLGLLSLSLISLSLLSLSILSLSLLSLSLLSLSLLSLSLLSLSLLSTAWLQQTRRAVQSAISTDSDHNSSTIPEGVVQSISGKRLFIQQKAGTLRTQRRSSSQSQKSNCLLNESANPSCYVENIPSTSQQAVSGVY
ncbi:unnamed protein product [Bursaphelenchus okinawaensis]|uniref:Uncharacterized protein n=1 Tax=Bursaphelenchus okinawaensis TaxID=465554 RepID=A0A811LSU6_9BILA|nr:unnamed protein product [Bursaphelenchus okinawaensis]CAG9128467.1 unnamed protein product [Bursaphelenchus okinawaensis]